MSPLAVIFLILHVLGAIIVFGPTFMFPVIANQARQSPQNGHFAAVLSEWIETKVVIPGAIIQGITGVALIITIGLDVTSAQWRYLIIAIVLYLIAIAYAVVVQAPAARRMVELSGKLTGPPPAGAPAGPPPEIAATAKQLQQGGKILTVLVVAIIILMVVKPTLG